MRAFSVGIKWWANYDTTVFAETHGKAKSQALLELSDPFPDIKYTDLTCRALGNIPVPPTPAELAQRDADAFNAKYPIGARFHFWTGVMEGNPTGTAATRHEATVVCEHAVAWFEGVVGCIGLSHVQPAGEVSE